MYTYIHTYIHIYIYTYEREQREYAHRPRARAQLGAAPLLQVLCATRTRRLHARCWRLRVLDRVCACARRTVPVSCVIYIIEGARARTPQSRSSTDDATLPALLLLCCRTAAKQQQHSRRPFFPAPTRTRHARNRCSLAFLGARAVCVCVSTVPPPLQANAHAHRGRRGAAHASTNARGIGRPTHPRDARPRKGRAVVVYVCVCVLCWCARCLRRTQRRALPQECVARGARCVHLGVLARN
jgi:hypothetical protein